MNELIFVVSRNSDAATFACCAVVCVSVIIVAGLIAGASVIRASINSARDKAVAESKRLSPPDTYITNNYGATVNVAEDGEIEEEDEDE